MKLLTRQKTTKSLIADIYGAIAAILFVTSATIVGEFASEFKDWLKAAFFHHWVGKGVLAVAVFLLVSFLSRRALVRDGDSEAAKGFYYLALASAVCGLILLGFFAYEAPSHL